MDWHETATALHEADMAYMKWVRTIKDAARIQLEQGMLGVLAARTRIPEGRLRTWLESKTIDELSRSELVALHAALCPPEDVVNVVSETESQRAEELAKVDRGRKCFTFADRVASFDESD